LTRIYTLLYTILLFTATTTTLTMFCAAPLSSIPVLLIPLACSFFNVSDASIRVVNLEREYQSRPDKYVGLQMNEGMEYGARLQRVVGNQYLCGEGLWQVEVPDDGRPVALLAKKGVCSYAQKAEFASRNIHPAGIVKILIIDGETRITDDNDDEDKIEHEHKHEFNGRGGDDNPDEDSTISSPDEDSTISSPDEDSRISSYEFPSYYNGKNESKVTLRRKYTDDISVALLHVSYQTGVELLDIILHEDPDVRNHGGTLLAVDGVAPPVNQAVIIFWTCIVAILAVLACCCLAGVIEDIFESQLPEPEPLRRRRRQRLTYDQVRKLLPIGIFDGSQLVYDEEAMIDNESGEDSKQSNNTFLQPGDHSLDACTICLDDYEVGDKLRCLPCRHAFHANCIAKWLIERSATCPLCNVELYEEDDDDEDEDEIEQRQQRQQSQQAQNDTLPTTATQATENAAAIENAEISWWRNIFRRSEQRSQVSEALTEPLLQQEQVEPSENAGSEPATVQEPLVSEESYDEEIADGSSSV